MTPEPKSLSIEIAYHVGRHLERLPDEYTHFREGPAHPNLLEKSDHVTLWSSFATPCGTATDFLSVSTWRGAPNTSRNDAIVSQQAARGE